MGTFRSIYNLYFSNNKALAKELYGLLGFVPNKMSIYKIAFQHKSSNGQQNGSRIINNERLEYLGDAILSTVVADYLYQKYPKGNEGFLTKMRSKIVKRKTLNEVGELMGLDMLMKQFNHTKLSGSMLGNALEALIGAVYLDQGFDHAHRFITGQILRKYLDINQIEHTDDNFKSMLLEWGQKNDHSIEYQLIEKYKFQKRDRYKMAVLVDGRRRGVADNYNKKSAEQQASKKACKTLGLIESSST